MQVHDVLLSKRLTKLLRHTALTEGVQIDREGWVSLADDADGFGCCVIPSDCVCLPLVAYR